MLARTSQANKSKDEKARYRFIPLQISSKILASGTFVITDIFNYVRIGSTEVKKKCKCNMKTAKPLYVPPVFPINQRKRKFIRLLGLGLKAARLFCGSIF